MSKVKLHFMAVGNAPIMKKSKFMVNASDPLHVVIAFLKKQLKLHPQDTLFVYCNSSFAPGIDQTLGTLYENFHINDALVLNYSLSKAWG